MEAEIWSFQTVPLTILGGKLKYYGSERFFNLRCPFWRRHERTIIGCELTDLYRAALWYSGDIEINDAKLHGIKALL